MREPKSSLAQACCAEPASPCHRPVLPSRALPCRASAPIACSKQERERKGRPTIGLPRRRRRLRQRPLLVAQSTRQKMQPNRHKTQEAASEQASLPGIG
jgi:hypothetical protein